MKNHKLQRELERAVELHQNATCEEAKKCYDQYAELMIKQLEPLESERLIWNCYYIKQKYGIKCKDPPKDNGY